MAEEQKNKIEYAKMDKANPDEWKVMIENIEVFSYGLLNIAIADMTGGGAPQIGAGGNALGNVIDIWGEKYQVFGSAQGGPAISGSPQIGTNYIFAAADGDYVRFEYGQAGLRWLGQFGGWYKNDVGAEGMKRAICKFYYVDGKYNGKVVLDSYESWYRVNTEQDMPSTGGVEIALSTDVNVEYPEQLARGAYRLELRGGKGGKGGDLTGGSTSYTGGTGADGESVTVNFFLTEPTVMYYSRGGGGENGGNGGPGGGGGGATGGASYAVIGGRTYIARGGSGGGGAGNGYPGGGGGGGAGNGGPGGSNRSGSGGSNGVGGDPGVATSNAYAGEGAGIENSYGQPGGGGKIITAANYEYVSKGGESRGLYAGYNRKLQNEFHGGGGGASSASLGSGDGGGNANDTDRAGSVRLFRLW